MGCLRRMDTRELIAFFSSARTRWRRSRRRAIVSHSNKRNRQAHDFSSSSDVLQGHKLIRERPEICQLSQGSKVSSGTFKHFIILILEVSSHQ